MNPEQLQEENDRLRRAIEELSILNDLARSISVQNDSQEMMQTIVRRSIRAVSAEQGVITLVKNEGGETGKTLIRSMVSTMGHDQYHFNQELLGWMYLNKKPLIIIDPKNDTRFRNLSSDVSFRSLIAVPLMVKSQLTGVLTVYDRKGSDPFTEDHARLLSIIAGQSAQIVENARLEEEERELRKMQEELLVATKIQNELLPKTMLHIPGYDLFATTISAKSVGGDYYDFLQSEGPGVALCVGDVSGKGMPASMLMANLQATLRASFEAQHFPAKVLEQSNRLLHKSTSDEKFATVFLALLDSALNELRYANAGHDPAMLLSADGTVKHLAATGIPVGMFDGMEYGESVVEMKHFDVLLIFTDGIAESPDAKENQFGRDRIQDCLLRTKDSSAAEIGHALLEEVAQFSKGMPQSDDRTILILKRT